MTWRCTKLAQLPTFSIRWQSDDTDGSVCAKWSRCSVPHLPQAWAEWRRAFCPLSYVQWWPPNPPTWCISTPTWVGLEVRFLWTCSFLGYKWLYSNDFPPRYAQSWMCHQLVGPLGTDERANFRMELYAEWHAQLQNCHWHARLWWPTSRVCNHLSAAVPGYSDRFLVIPYGLLWCLGISLELACEDISPGQIIMSGWYKTKNI